LKKTTKKVKASPVNGQLKPTRVFSDFLESGGNGPVMVGVPGGIFTMGSPDNSTHFNERPQHKVSIRKFSIAKHEVTFDDYDRFAENTGRPRPADNGWGRGKRPVVNVTWEDAVAYTQWLSEQTGHQYRLPSEAEWEYAARAGTKDNYWWGSQYEGKRANCFNCGSRWDGSNTAPVGSFSTSSLGLHDMLGNVMEWVSDCYHKNYDGAPIDGMSWAGESCGKRVVRGGSFHSPTDEIRVSRRSEFAADAAIDQIGFRVVRVR
jgi:formylglycine-generating enzyme required for sulfatase activity